MEKYREATSVYCFTWTAIQIILLSIYSDNIVTTTFASVQLSSIFLTVRFGIDKDYNRMVPFILMCMILGIFTILSEGIEQKQIGPIGINSIIPTIVTALIYIILFINLNYEKYKKNRVANCPSEKFPPAVYASGSIDIYN